MIVGVGKMAPMYDVNGKKINTRKKNVRVGIGPSSVGFWNLKDNAKGADGKYINTPNAMPRSVEAWRWPSVKAYHKQSLNSQLKVLSENIHAWSRHLGDHGPNVVYNALIPTLTKSRIYCPKDTHLLVNSSRLEIIEKRKAKGGTRGESKVSITYGDKGIPFYAVIVHENLSFKHASPTRAKFLESAVREDIPRIKREIIKESVKLTGK